MDPVRQTQKKYGSGAMTVAILVAFFLILAGQKPIARGLILGTIFSVINFVLIGQTLPGRLSKQKSKTFLFSLSSIILRHALLAVPLIMAVKIETFNLPAVICGVFMIQLVILAEHFLRIVTSRQKQA
jgi:hypothetical protein